MHISKRIIYFLVSFTAISAITAQNRYHIAEIKTNAVGMGGVNPRFLNSERDDWAEGRGWSALAWDTLTKGYTVEDSIPFAFKFNGASNVKLDGKFRATKNGTVTFNDFKTGPSVLPAADFVINDLPDPRIANHSAIVGGIIASGANDRVLVKMFGVAPHRQYWIKFHSFTLGTDTANKYGSYSYNAIVLEEFTGSIHLVRMGWGSEHAWYANNFPLKNQQANGLQLGPFETYPLAGVSDLYNTVAKQGKGFEDNSFVSFYTGVQKLTDASLALRFTNSPAGTSYVKSGNNVPLEITGVFTMHGSADNTNYDLNVQVNGEAVVSSALSLVSLTDYRSVQFTHTALRTMQPGDRARLRVWLTLSGGANDDNVKNDTLPLVYDFIAQEGNSIAKSIILVEAYTATWCSQCPAANQILDSLQVKFAGKAIFVSHHINDNMNNSNAPAQLDSMPFVVINRKKIVGNPKLYASAVESAISQGNQTATVTVKDLVFNPKTRNVTGKLELQSLDALDKGGIRFGVMLREKTVRGLGAGWDQRVEFNLTKDSQSIFFGKNKTLVGYHHNRVVWSTDGGKHGTQISSLSGVMKSGETLSYSFSLTVPDTMLSLGMPTAADFGPTGAIFSRFKPADLSVVGYIASDFGMGFTESKNLGTYGAELLAVVEQPIWDFALGGDLLVRKEQILLYPNPASDKVRILSASAIMQVVIMDVMGRCVLDLGAVESLDLTEFSSGTYFVRVKTNTGVSTSRLVVQ